MKLGTVVCRLLSSQNEVVAVLADNIARARVSSMQYVGHTGVSFTYDGGGRIGLRTGTGTGDSDDEPKNSSTLPSQVIISCS